MSDSNTDLIECTYGKHMCNIEDFTKSGLNKKYFTQCRKCRAKQMKKYRQKYGDEYRDKVREGNRIRKANERARKKAEKTKVIEQKQDNSKVITQII
jgi:hypothetical protein